LEVDVMKKSWITLVIFVFAVLAVFAGGGKEQAAVPVDPNAPVEVSVWCWNPRTNIFSMKTAEEIYRREHPNFSINIIETSSDDVQQKLVTALSANQTAGLPDIFLCQDNNLMKNILTYPDAFVAVNDKIDMSKFAAYKVEKGTLNGKSYGVPYDNAATGLFIRRDYIEQAGLKVEDFSDITWDKFVELGKIVKAKTGHPMLSQYWTSMDILMTMLQSTGTWFFNEDGSLNLINNTTLRAAMILIKNMIDEGVILMVNDNNAYNAALNNGTVAGIVQGSWIVGTLTSEKSQEGKWAVVSTPRFGNIPNGINASNQGGSSWVILSSSKNINPAIDFLDKTFGGSVELYETILPYSGHVGTYLPVGNSPVYNQSHPFFGGQKIYADFIKWAEKVPRVKYGIYNYEARDAALRAVSDMAQGRTLDQALETAHRNVQFLMEQ
jgi:lactose/L-arabinose transport system substrate-binding protein